MHTPKKMRRTRQHNPNQPDHHHLDKYLAPSPQNHHHDPNQPNHHQLDKYLAPLPQNPHEISHHHLDKHLGISHHNNHLATPHHDLDKHLATSHDLSSFITTSLFIKEDLPLNNYNCLDLGSEQGAKLQVNGQELQNCFDLIRLYENRDVERWTSEECLEWAQNLLWCHGYMDPDLYAISGTTGQDLVQYSRHVFSLLFGPHIGQILHTNLTEIMNAHNESLNQVSDGQTYVVPQTPDFNHGDDDDYNGDGYLHQMDVYDPNVEEDLHFDTPGAHSVPVAHNLDASGAHSVSMAHNLDASGPHSVSMAHNFDTSEPHSVSMAHNFDTSEPHSVPVAHNLDAPGSHNHGAQWSQYRESLVAVPSPSPPLVSMSFNSYTDLPTSKAVYTPPHVEYPNHTFPADLHRVPRSPDYPSSPSPMTPETPWIKIEPDQAEPLDPASPQQSSPFSAPCFPSFALMKVKSRGRNRERKPKTWEYLARLLVSRTHNPAWIRWEDRAAGTFRLVAKEAIAKAWGQRYTMEEQEEGEAEGAVGGLWEKNNNSKKNKKNKNNNKELAYDNFARGLRYHYKTQALEPVSEKQLVYKWGTIGMKFIRDLEST